MMRGFNHYVEGRELPILLVLILSTGAFVFRDFLLFKNVYLYKDIGSDSLNAIYPQLVHLTDYLRNEGIPKWSFNQGLGQNYFPLSFRDPFWIIYFMLGRANLAYGLAYVELLKVVLAGVFFYLYLKKLDVTKFSAIVGSLLYSFTGFMILGGGWLGFSYQALCAALLLYSFERYFRDGVWYLLPIPMILLVLYQPFYFIMYGVLLLVYACVRYIEEEGWNAKGIGALLLKIAGLSAIGAAAGSVYLFSNVYQVLQSPRVGGNVSYFRTLSSQPIFAFAESKEYISILLRTFSSDLLGTGNYFRGWGNYLESPLTYCGLASLLLAPQFFFFLNRRRRFLYSGVTGLCLLPIIFPFFRYLFWGFTGNYYRTFSFVIVLLLLFFSTRALGFIDKSSRINRKLLIATLLLTLFILYLPFEEIDRVINPRLRFTILIFLVTDAALVWLMSTLDFKRFGQLALLVAVCIELAYLSSITVNNRELLSSEELKQKTGYQDYTNEAVGYLTSADKTFFRIEKDYYSSPAMNRSLNDALIQRYKGTSSYHQFNQRYYIRFLQELGVISLGDETQTRWAPGLYTRPYLQTLVNVKYHLIKITSNDSVTPRYEYLTTLGNVRVFRNKHYLPFGFTYDSCMLMRDFSRLSAREKNQVLLRAAVIEDDDVERFRGFHTFSIDQIVPNYTLDSYGNDVNSRRLDTLSLREHTQKRIRGTINLQKQKLLFFSIPYDKGWLAKVDGKEKKLELVNVGFMALPLDQGVHMVELEYSPPLVKEGLVGTIMTALLYFFLLARTKGKVAKPVAVSTERTGDLKKKSSMS